METINILSTNTISTHIIIYILNLHYNWKYLYYITTNYDVMILLIILHILLILWITVIMIL